MTHSFHRLRSIPARLVTAAAVVSALVAAAGTYPVAPSAATSASDTVARAGIAQVRTYTCKGRKLSQGTGFVIGKSVVMTTRRILNNACTAVVTVNGRSIVAKDWATLAAAGVKEAATDLATIRLSKAAAGAHVFRIRAAGPAVGEGVTVAGYPAGSGLVIRQGKLVWRGTKAGAPLLAAKVAGVTAADGAPLLDSAGLVTGIVQAGRAARDVPGSRADVLEGLDLSRWWTPSARYDICQAYKGSGILNCPTRAPAPTPEPTPTPTPTPAPTPSPVPETGPVPTPDPTPQPPRAPTDYAIASCWVQYTADSWDNVAAARRRRRRSRPPTCSRKDRATTGRSCS